MKIAFTTLLFFTFLNLNAQNSLLKEQINKRAFHGFESEIEYAVYPAYLIDSSPSRFDFNQWESVGINLSYFFRFNILELGSDQSISLGCNPILGLRLGFNPQRSSFYPNSINEPLGFGSLHIPISFNYHLGKGATKNSTYKFGLTLSVGKEFRLDPIFYFYDSPEDRVGLERNYKGYVLQLGLMREKKRLHQFYFRTVILNNSASISFSSFQAYYINDQIVSAGIRIYRKHKK